MSPPDPGERPPGPRRAPSSPKLEIFDSVGEDAVKPRHDRPRAGTLTGLGALRPPLPPVEFQATMPAPSTLAATARPSPPVALPSPDNDAPASGRAEAREAILEAELAKERARVAELERQARVRVETSSPATYPPQVTPAPPERPTKAPESAAGDGSTKALRSALTKLLLGLAGLLALLAVPLTAYIQALTTQIQRATNQAAQATSEAADAKKSNSKATQEAAASKAELAQFKAYFREVMRLQGVEIAKHKEDPEAGDLKPVTPLCPTGKVCPGPQIIITVPP